MKRQSEAEYHKVLDHLKPGNYAPDVLRELDIRRYEKEPPWLQAEDLANQGSFWGPDVVQVPKHVVIPYMNDVTTDFWNKRQVVDGKTTWSEADALDYVTSLEAGEKYKLFAPDHGGSSGAW